ncbi:Predicted membrane protein [Chlamydia trachomatis]|nr:Predicted membrane protein [Chlamydia trachomatis]
MDNIIVIRKIFGNTKILVPIDVAVTLNVSSIYGSVDFFECQQYDLRNESIKLREVESQQLKKVKIVVTTIAGNVEVDRR